MVNGMFNVDKYGFSLPYSTENFQDNGHLMNPDHQQNDQICIQNVFKYSPGKGIYIASCSGQFYHFASLRFTWNPPEII